MRSIEDIQAEIDAIMLNEAYTNFDAANSFKNSKKGTRKKSIFSILILPH